MRKRLFGMFRISRKCLFTVIAIIPTLIVFYNCFSLDYYLELFQVPSTRTGNGLHYFKAAINDALSNNGSLLVWGLKHDTELLHDISVGKVVFIEDGVTESESKSIVNKYPFSEIHTVHFISNATNEHRTSWRLSDLDVSAQLPSTVIHGRWQIIIINMGIGSGRYQAMYTSKVLANEYTHIFVIDRNIIENHDFTHTILGNPLEVFTNWDSRHARKAVLAHFVLSEPKSGNADNKRSLRRKFQLVNSNSTWNILLSVNDAFFDFFQNWYWHYQRLNLNLPIIIVSEDNTVYEKLVRLNLDNVFIERSDLVSIHGPVNYNTVLYKKMVSARPSYILDYLLMGLNVIFSDVDIVWLQNPLPFFTGKFDIWSQLDKPEYFCPGFMAIQSNTKTKQFIQTWKYALQNRPNLNQGIFNSLIKHSIVNIQALDSNKFPSGRQYFSKFSSDQRSNVVVVHNNYIVGHDKKRNRFQNFHLWFV